MNEMKFKIKMIHK